MEHAKPGILRGCRDHGSERNFEAELYRVKGDLLLMRDPSDEAEPERCFRTAIDVACRQKARFFELRATTSLALLLKRQGKRKRGARDAGGNLRLVYRGFRIR